MESSLPKSAPKIPPIAEFHCKRKTLALGLSAWGCCPVPVSVKPEYGPQESVRPERLLRGLNSFSSLLSLSSGLLLHTAPHWHDLSVHCPCSDLLALLIFSLHVFCSFYHSISLPTPRKLLSEQFSISYVVNKLINLIVH